MARLPEGVLPYPRWRGQLRPGDQWFAVAANEIQTALRTNWGMFTVLAGLFWGLSSVVQVAQWKETVTGPHQLDWFITMLDQLRWAGVAVAAAVGAPALLQDARAGALELYMSRSVSRRGYLWGKAAALLALVTATMVIPIILYYVATLIFYDQHPPNWNQHAAMGLVYAVQWALLVSGVALGASCLLRSTRGAVLVFLGVFAGLDIVVRNLLGSLTEQSEFDVVSPFASQHQVIVYLFDVEAPFSFPPLWGLLVWLGLTIVGWTLLVWLHPRVRGEERA